MALTWGKKHYFLILTVPKTLKYFRSPRYFPKDCLSHVYWEKYTQNMMVWALTKHFCFLYLSPCCCNYLLGKDGKLNKWTDDWTALNSTQWEMKFHICIGQSWDFATRKLGFLNKFLKPHAYNQMRSKITLNELITLYIVIHWKWEHYCVTVWTTLKSYHFTLHCLNNWSKKAPDNPAIIAWRKLDALAWVSNYCKKK